MTVFKLIFKLRRSLIFFLITSLLSTRSLLGTLHRSKLLKTNLSCASSTNLMSTETSWKTMEHQPSWKAYRLVTDDAITKDWVKSLELTDAKAALTNPKFLPNGDDGHPPRILVLYGSLRTRSFSKFLAYEFGRILELLGAEVRIFDPRDLPPHDVEVNLLHPKVTELRDLTLWSEGQVWVTPEQHGAITGLIKTQLGSYILHIFVIQSSY
jgi:hypothetical protein